MLPNRLDWTGRSAWHALPAATSLSHKLRALMPSGLLRMASALSTRAAVAALILLQTMSTVTLGQELQLQDTKGKAPLAPFFAANDGGAYYVREDGEKVYWFAEHPGVGYAHVFAGSRKGKKITGRFWDIPKGGAMATGRVTLEVQSNGSLKVIDKPKEFSPDRLKVKSIAEVVDILPRRHDAGFQSTKMGDLTGTFDDIKYKYRFYVRETKNDKVVFLMEKNFKKGQRPFATYVFVGERDGNTVKGTAVSVPKGKHKGKGNLTIRVKEDRILAVTTPVKLYPKDTPREKTKLIAFPPTRNRKITLLRHRDPIQIVTLRSGDRELIEGDIIVGGGTFTDEASFRALAIRHNSMLWKGGILPYEIDNNVPDSLTTRITAAINQINSRTNIQVVKRKEEAAYVKFTVDNSIAGAGQSPVGRQEKDKGQHIVLTTSASAGNIMHEMCHALGMFHEQNRIDRDEYVEIVRGNIVSGQGDNFKKHVGGGLDFGPYDYGSIMHYGRTFFGKPINANRRMTTIIPKREGVTIGQRNGLSDGDVAGLNNLYPEVQKVEKSMGKTGDGAGIAVTNLDDDSRPEVIMMVYDAPSGQNKFKVTIGYNIDISGRTTDWMDQIMSVPGLGQRGDGAGLAIADLDGNGRPEMILMAYDGGDGQNRFKWQVGPNLDKRGVPTQPWKQRQWHDGVGTAGHGAGIDIADIDRDGDLDMILMAYDAPKGQNKIKYLVGKNVDANGAVAAANWLGPMTVAGLGERGDGAGVAVVDFNRNNVPDLIFMVYDNRVIGGVNYDNEFKHRILLDVTSDGASSGSGDEQRWSFNGLGHRGEGAGIAAVDLDKNGFMDLVLVAYDAPEGANRLKYKVLRDVWYQR